MVEFGQAHAFVCVASARCGGLHAGVLGVVFLRRWLAFFSNALSDLRALWRLSFA